MARSDRLFPARRDTYRHQTLRPLNSLLFILPLLLFFHVAAAFYGTDLLALRDVAKVLRFFGATVAYLPALAILVVLFVQHLARRDRFHVHGATLAGMLVESIAWTLPLVALVHVMGRLTAGALAAARHAPQPLLQQLVVAVGAALYEEFIFRLVLIGLLLLLFVDVFDLHRQAATVFVVVFSAVCFSLYHFSRQHFTGELPFPWHPFAFRGLAGVYLGGLLLLRGFGITVGAHAVYNVYVVFYHLK
jgi:hypothetical protein